MKKILLVSFLAFGFMGFSQTYCVPEFEDGCAIGQIDSFEIPSASFSHMNTGCSPNAHGDYTSQVINLNAGLNYPFSVTHNFALQNIRIWIDFDNNGTFDDVAPELVAEASSDQVNGVDITNGTMVIPANVAPGTYRMRVGDRFIFQPEPCNTLGYGEAHDYTVNIGAAPSCLAPGNLSAGSVTSSSATVSWVASASTVGVGYEYYISTLNTAPVSTTAASGTALSTATSVVIPNL